MQLKKKTSDAPNFSIILPGECNARCEFCFWKRSKSESPSFLKQLKQHLDNLGDVVTQISITGGEPTISPLFDNLMKLLSGYSSKKIVLTTNGTLLKKKLPRLQGIVKHINISRHKVLDSENYTVFRNLMPSQSDLWEICRQANAMGIDVTINKVIPHDYDDNMELGSFLRFVREIGASALTLRKDYSINSLDSTPLEKRLGFVGRTSSCPVCRTDSYIISGTPVHFKMSLKEPSKKVPYIYEFVCHPNGDLYEDWAGKKPIEFISSRCTTTSKGAIHSS